MDECASRAERSANASVSNQKGLAAGVRYATHVRCPRRDERTGAMENGTVQDEPEEDPAIIAQRASLMARAALIIACMALAVSILGLFLPLRP